MVRFLGFGKKQGASKRRLSQTARTSQTMRDNHPMYQYALNEFAQTVQAGSTNDDGRHRPPQDPPKMAPSAAMPTAASNASAAASSISASTTSQTTSASQGYHAPAIPPAPMTQQRTQDLLNEPHNSNNKNGTTALPPLAPGLAMPSHYSQQPPTAPAPTLTNSEITTNTTNNHSRLSTSHSTTTTASNNHHSVSTNMTNPNQSIMTHTSSLHAEPALSRDWSVHSDNFSRVESSPRTYQKSPFEEGVVSNILYEESYGDAYTGAPLRYVYPTGYQSMRPRSGPWRLSILICLCFTWLSVFVVGHCSDQVSEQYNELNEDIDDDTVLIEIRWCGSRPLYLMWLASMIITGLSAAYCGVIGYIKARDFAVANSRAQPFLMEPQSSDYYYYLESLTATERSSIMSSTTTQQPPRRESTSSIYQADGTPQFWGSQIFRPTQAAVAVTSR